MLRDIPNIAVSKNFQKALLRNLHQAENVRLSCNHLIEKSKSGVTGTRITHAEKIAKGIVGITYSPFVDIDCKFLGLIFARQRIPLITSCSVGFKSLEQNLVEKLARGFGKFHSIQFSG